MYLFKKKEKNLAFMVIIMIIASCARICFYQLFFSRSVRWMESIIFSLFFYQHIIYDNCVRKIEREGIGIEQQSLLQCTQKPSPAFVWLASGAADNATNRNDDGVLDLSNYNGMHFVHSVACGQMLLLLRCKGNFMESFLFGF